MPRLAVMCEQLAPYHVSRLEALKDLGQVVAIELTRQGYTYAWDGIDKTAFRRITLIGDKSWNEYHDGALIANLTHNALDDQRPSCVVTTGWSMPIELAALSWCQKTNTPAVVMSDSQAHDKRRFAITEHLKRRVVRLFSAALAGGAPHVAYLRKLGMPADRIFTGCDVVHNEYFADGASDARKSATEIRHRLGLPRKFFLVSNRFLPCKNLPRLLNAYSSYRHRAGAGAWKLLMLGDGELKPQVLQLLKQFHLEADVFLPGFCQIDVLPSYYGLTSAFILASTKETWGLVVNEAMASGLPVLVSNRCGCTTDLVENGHNGYVFDPLDVEELADHMTKMSDGRYDLAAMGRASREIIGHWGIEKFATNLGKAVKAAMTAPRPKAYAWDRGLLWALTRRPQAKRN